jgi:hypothetical protein
VKQIQFVANVCLCVLARVCFFSLSNFSGCDAHSVVNGFVARCEYYRICSRNLRTFFSVLAAEKSVCVKDADFFCGGLDLGFILV